MVSLTIEDSVEGMFVLDAIQRRITALAEQEMTPNTIEAESVEQVLAVLGRVERRLRDALYPTEPLFPYLDSGPVVLSPSDPSILWHEFLDR